MKTSLMSGMCNKELLRHALICSSHVKIDGIWKDDEYVYIYSREYAESDRHVGRFHGDNLLKFIKLSEIPTEAMKAKITYL